MRIYVVLLCDEFLTEIYSKISLITRVNKKLVCKYTILWTILLFLRLDI